MSVSGTLGVAVSGLTANAVRFQVSASNVVNADSRGHTARDVATVSQVAGPAPGGVRAITFKKAEAEVEVAGEFVKMNQISAAYTANAKVISTVEEMTGALLDILV